MRVRTMAMAVLLLVSGSAGAEGVPMKEEKPGLLRKAKVDAKTATAAAQAKVPAGKIVSAEIEEENGKLVYSFDLKTKGKSGIDEVTVDALTGTVSVVHESPKDEVKEKAADNEQKKK